MTDSIDLPPNMSETDRVVLFDGVCRFCSGWARFLIKHDRSVIFKLAPVQSPEGIAILEHFGFPTDHYDTMVLVEGPKAYVRSTALIRILMRLGLPWKLFAIAWICPAFIRNFFYDRLANNRYRIMGRYDSCVVLTPDTDQRFVRSQSSCKTTQQ